VGELPKTEVRRIAAEIGLPNAKKKDSTGICFIGERPFREFLNRYLSHEPGPIVDERGREARPHVGLSFYTLGQRQGLGIGGVKDKGAAPRRRRARALVRGAQGPGRNTLVVVQGHDHPWLQSRSLVPRRRQLGRRPRRRRRRPLRPRPATARPMPPAAGLGDGQRLRWASTPPQWAVTPGQSAVLYDGEVCLGGGGGRDAVAMGQHAGLVLGHRSGRVGSREDGGPLRQRLRAQQPDGHPDDLQLAAHLLGTGPQMGAVRAGGVEEHVDRVRRHDGPRREPFAGGGQGIGIPRLGRCGVGGRRHIGRAGGGRGRCGGFRGALAAGQNQQGGGCGQGEEASLHGVSGCAGTGVGGGRAPQVPALRNYPVIGHLRFLLEFIRPEIRQYFIESDNEAAPFSRQQRSLVYQRAKGDPDKRPFGTQLDVAQQGYEWINHSLQPTGCPRTTSASPSAPAAPGVAPCTQPTAPACSTSRR
jgi:hypothetical protein